MVNGLRISRRQRGNRREAAGQALRGSDSSGLLRVRINYQKSRRDRAQRNHYSEQKIQRHHLHSGKVRPDHVESNVITWNVRETSEGQVGAVTLTKSFTAALLVCGVDLARVSVVDVLSSEGFRAFDVRVYVVLSLLVASI